MAYHKAKAAFFKSRTSTEIDIKKYSFHKVKPFTHIQISAPFLAHPGAPPSANRSYKEIFGPPERDPVPIKKLINSV